MNNTQYILPANIQQPTPAATAALRTWHLHTLLQCALLYAVLLLPHTLFSQTYPVTANTQIIPPYSVYLADYAVPGSDKLRVILLQNDLTVASYDVRLQMTIELNGSVIMRSSPAFNPRPLTLSPGVPTIIGGSDLYDYLNSNNIDFSGGYSRETYERTKALPEGAYKISFTAYDYRRADVQVSNTGSNVFFFQKKNPPLLNMPVCGSRVEKRDPQFLSFSWSNINAPSLLPGSETEYTFSLFEIRPANSNPDYIVRSTRPVYTLTTQQNLVLYGPGEPPLIDSMQYVWIVQARDRDGRDMYSNQGYSQSCTFTYLGFNPFAAGNINKPKLFAEAKSDRTAKLWWQLNDNPQTTVETYRIEYRAAAKGGTEFPWYVQEKPTDSTLTLYSLEPGRNYEARLQWRIAGVYGPYSETVPFTTQPLRTFTCGDAAADIALADNSQPLPNAVAGMTVKIGAYDVLLNSVSGGNGSFSGQGRVITNGFGYGLLMEFSNVFINTGLVVIRGEMRAVTERVEALVSEAIVRQQQADAFKQFAGGVPGADALLPQLQSFAEALINLPPDKVEDALALTQAEKTVIQEAKEKAAAAVKVLNNPNATEPQKQEAEQNLRKAIGNAKPALDKLAATLDKGLQTVVGDWFKNIRAFLNGYKGSKTDQQQAVYWHRQTDSAVAAIRSRKDIPDSLLEQLNKADAAAVLAWAALEAGTDIARTHLFNQPMRTGGAAVQERSAEKAVAVVLELVRVIEELHQWKAAMSDNVEIDKLLAWLKNNKGKTVDFKKEDFYKSRSWVDVPQFAGDGKQGQFVVYVELGEDGRVDFQTNAATGQFNSYSVSINYEGKYADKYHTGFSLKIKYADKNEAAITLWTYSYNDFQKLLKLLEIDLSNAAKDFFYEQYSTQLSNAGNDCDKLDVLYENIPPFVVGRLNKEQRWQSLKSLLGCVVDDGSSLVGGTDEEEAVINLLKSYYTEWNWLYNKLYSDKQVVYQLYEKVDGDNLLAVMEVMRQCADESGKDESGTSKYIYIGNAGEAYSGNTFLYGYPYVLTEQSGWSKAYDINLHSVIGSPNTSLSVEVRQQTSDVENIHPLDRIKVYKDEPGNMELLPAVYAYYLGTRQNRQELLSAIGKTANVLATVTASRVLFSAGESATMRVLAALQLAKTGLDIAMADKEVQAELDKTEEGKWFKQKWPIISITTDVTLLGADIISGLAKNGSRAAADIEKIKNGKYKDAADELKEVAKAAGDVVTETWDWADDFVNGLLDANKYIQEGRFIPNVKKIDLMGGKTSQLGGDFANIDLQAIKGINGDASKLSQYIQPNSIDEIIVSNPFPTAPFAGPKEFFLIEASKVMKPGTTLTVNGTINNKFFKNIKTGNIEDLGFEIVEFQVPLKSQFQNMKFYQVDGITQIPNSSILSTVIRKK